MFSENLFEKEFSKKSLFADRNLMTPHYIPKELPFREKQMREMTEIVGTTLRGNRANNLFIYGKTGTGKTSATKNVMGQLIAFAHEKEMPVDSCYINCRTHNSKYKVLAKTVKHLYPRENFIGFSAAFVYEKILEHVNSGARLVIVLDEIDKVKDLDELIYSLTRGNDEVGSAGGISIMGISNNLFFKERLDPRTKSGLCEQEMVFPPYNAEELREILRQRVNIAFRDDCVADSAINLAAAYAAHESGDARTAVMLLLRAGELAERKGSCRVTDEEVEKAKSKVEEEIILNMVSTLPRQQQLVLYAIACLTVNKKPFTKITGETEKGVLFSGEIYDEYARIAKGMGEDMISSRWYRQYISEMEMYGLIFSTGSGKGIKGQTRLIKLGFDAPRIKEIIERDAIRRC